MARRAQWWASLAARKPALAVAGLGALGLLAATVGIPGGGSAETSPAAEVAAFTAFPAEGSAEEPVAPVGLTVTAVSPTAVSLRWRPSTDALPAGWVVDHRISGGTTWTSTEVDAAATAITLDDLAEGTDYDLRVVAVDEDRRSTAALVTARTTVTDPIPIVERTSSEGSATESASTAGEGAAGGSGAPAGGAGSPGAPAPSTGDPTTASRVPGAPTGLVALPGDGTVVLTWTAPGDADGAPVADWVLEVTDGSGWQPAVDADGNAADATATISGLVNGTGYGFRVAARNDAGTGTFADPVSATPAPARLLATAGGTATDDAHAIAALADGSTVLTGSFGGTATFGSITVTSAGGADIYVARLSPVGTWTWVTTVGTPGTDVGRAITALPDGSAVVTGQVAGSAAFGGTTVPAFGGADVFVARISPTGEWQWATSAGGNGADDGRGVTALPDGSAVVVGSIASSASFGATDLSGAGGADLFAARIDPTGTWTWARRGGGTGGDHAAAVAALPDGSVVLTGWFEGTASFGGTALSATGADDLVVAKLSADGDWTWAARAGGSGPDAGRAVTVHADGSAVVAGTLGGTAVVAGTVLTPIGGTDLLVASISSDGDWGWALAGGSTADDHLRGIVTRADGSTFVAGQLGAEATLGTTAVPSAGGLDLLVGAVTIDGAWAWAVSAGGTDTDLARAVTLLPDGSPAVAGELVGPAVVGTLTYTGLGASDALVLKPTPAGLLP